MENKFTSILQEDEQIKYCKNINIKANVFNTFLMTWLFGLFPPVAVLMLGIPYTLVLFILSLTSIIPMWIGTIHFSLSCFAIIIYLIILYKNSNNTYFCITNKRIILREGAFANKYTQYSLNNIGNVEVKGNIFDSQKEESATLLITTKSFHTNTDGNGRPIILKVPHLKDAYNASKVLSKAFEGKNESFRVKLDKE